MNMARNEGTRGRCMALVRGGDLGIADQLLKRADGQSRGLTHARLGSKAPF